MLRLCKDKFSIEYKLTNEERKLYFESLKKFHDTYILKK